MKQGRQQRGQLGGALDLLYSRLSAECLWFNKNGL
jgi:hypothetical protein